MIRAVRPIRKMGNPALRIKSARRIDCGRVFLFLLICLLAAGGGLDFLSYPDLRFYESVICRAGSYSEQIMPDL